MKLYFRFINASKISCIECLYYIPSIYPANNPGSCVRIMYKNIRPATCFVFKIFKRL